MFKTHDPLGRSIQLKANTYNYKIANIFGINDDKRYGNSHPDVTTDDIKYTIENPTFIFKDTKTIKEEDGTESNIFSTTREEYFSISIDSEQEKLKANKVIVEFDEAHTSGDVVTAHRENKVSRVKAKEGGLIYDVHK